MKILLAEDDAPLADKLVRALHAEAFAVDVAPDGEDALHLARTGHYDCIVLDLGLPVVDGVTVLRRLRAESCDWPILILTARDAWADKATGFEAGADDYLTKPFLAAELTARMRALIRRARGQTAPAIHCGPLTYEPQTGAFSLDGEPLRLTAFETRILSTLVRSPEAVVERDRLFESVYEHEAEIVVSSFEVLIGRLRRKIGPHMIETVRGQGYRLTAGRT